ncbi:smoothened homolog [Strongylocentrotus purpuratus]|uniref:Protein smoothened n=1 Tax=Strongylocentrotus purpuratus TaxID=7668 RepID=A0A7M7N503_STRPU|nr:smoothened homolog [Strongylocentrotus purpuratus]
MGGSLGLKMTSCSGFLLLLLLLSPALHAQLSVNFSITTGNDCTRPAVCTPLPANMTRQCLGTDFSHTHISLSLANDSVTIQEVNEKLVMWKGLRNVPKCWEVVQPLLCAVYMPKCEDGRVELPSYDMCNVVQSPCRIVELERGWPHFLQCNEEHMPRDCSEPNTYKAVTFNLTGGCEPPLVETDNEKSWYENVEGCGIQCKNPLYTEEDHHKVHIFIAVFAGLCVVCTLFTLCTFFADWKNSSKYPAVILFYMNGCFFLGSIGFLAQFSDGAREDIVCRHDGTMRLAEPSEGENLSCVIVFVIVYYFILAGVFWFVMLAYSWHLSFRALGTPKDPLQGKPAYFHLISWTMPFVLVVIILAINQVDGDSVAGICFVGYQNHYYRAGFVLSPIGLCLVSGGFYLVQGLVTLCTIDKENPGLLSDKASTKIKGTIARIGVFAGLAFGFVFITFACHLYEFTNQAQWEKGFQDYLVCEANVTLESQLVDDVNTLPTCALKTRPNLTIVMVHLFSMFGAGIAMSMWVWTPATLAIWKRMWRKVTRQPINEPVKLKKSKMIAKAFAKKRDKGNDDEEDRLSLSFESVSHDDAIGMKLDLPPSSVVGDDPTSSSSWGNNVPVRMLARRGAAYPIATIGSSPRATPDSSDSGRPLTRGRTTLETEAVIEPPPRNNRRTQSSRSRRQGGASSSRKHRLRNMHHPGRLETPLDDAFSDAEDCMELPEAPGMVGDSVNMVQGGAWGHKGRSLSTIPVLPAIQQKKRVSIMQQPTMFEMPGESGIEHAL